MIVWGAGKLPNDVMLVGEAPSKEEAAKGQPFVGKSGKEQETYLSRHHLTARKWYRTNVCKEYTEGNPDPTPEQIEEWAPVLENEIKQCRPKLVVTVGRFATRWFLGEDVDMEYVHGLPQRSSRTEAVVVPCYHPAFGFHNNDARALIGYDYDQVAKYRSMQRRGIPVHLVDDPYDGIEDYQDVTGKGIAALVSNRPSVISLDTEGYPTDPWSLQVSMEEGTGFLLRYSQPDFNRGIEALQRCADKGTTYVMHNAMYDIEMSRVMGLDLRDAPIWDSMYAAYLMRLEPQSLKALAWRWLRMKMASYMDTIGDAALDRQIDYMVKAYLDTWEDPEPRIVHKNDGTAKVYTPWSITRRAEAILKDYSSKPDVDVYDRWSKLDTDLKEQVEHRYGPMPFGTLADIPLEDALFYSARDADASIRLYNALAPELEERGLSTLMDQGMEVLPIFEEMQATGLFASKSYFQALREEMQLEMDSIQSLISNRYYGGKPFNPMSSKQVAAIIRRRDLTAMKRTESGQISTSKKSIEHLREEDKAIDAIFDWRERYKINNTFCDPILERMSKSDDDLQIIRCNIKTTRVHTRRLATSKPNFLGVPARSDLGLRVRQGFVAPDGEVFVGSDMSQIEVRCAAHLTQDSLLIERIIEGDDLHRFAASRIFRILPEEVTREQRVAAKATTFGILYGIGGPGLLDSLRMFGVMGWTEKQCEELIESYLDVFSGLRDYQVYSKNEARKTGEVRDIWGMPRYIPGVWARDNKVRAEAERVAFSHQVQGMAQGMIQRSMAWLRPIIRDLQKSGMNIKWNLQIHDELMMQCDEDLAEMVLELLKEALTEHVGLKLSVPLEADGSISKTWAGLK